MTYIVPAGPLVAEERTRAEGEENARARKSANLGDLTAVQSAQLNLGLLDLPPAACVATANVATLNGLQTFDGYKLASGDPVLLVAQNAKQQNGIWVAAAGAWTRPAVFPTGAVVNVRKILVLHGEAHEHDEWLLLAGPTEIDTMLQSWVRLTVGDIATALTEETSARSAADAVLANAIVAVETASAQGFKPTTIKTGAYPAAPGDYIPANISGGSVPVTLPTKPPDKTRVGGKIIAVSGTPGSTTFSFKCGGSDVFNKAGGSTTVTYSAELQGVVLQYAEATGIWYVQTTDTPLNKALGAAQLGTDATVGGPEGSPLSPSVASGSPTAVVDAVACQAIFVGARVPSVS